jgi:hypothetical protein
MLRWTVAFVAVSSVAGAAIAADLGPNDRRAAVSRAPPPVYARPHGGRVVVEEEPEILFTPSDGALPYIPPLVGTPLLPGSATLPGYYGSTHSYQYRGPYYGGPYVGYWDRLPYACGVYGYC